ncbi:MAG: type I methionyl aminopeptidase [Actinomycetaceae bacterium]|nr:type I methionyl aminopeptidase [Actinomycetaceae bacterium]
MPRIEIKTAEQIKWMREAGLVVAKIHAALREAAKPGVTLLELDEVSAQVIAQNDAKSNFLGYGGFPATVCISVNDTVVHGIPDMTRLEAGDLVSFDCGAYVERGGRQWHGDAAFTMIVGGDEAGSMEARRLNAVTEASMWAALASVATGRRVSAIGDAVEEAVEEYRDGSWTAGIIEEYTGHGIGTAMHQAPEVLNYSARGMSPRIKEGMVLAVEPMLTDGDIETYVLEDEWTVKTADGSLASHWEHTVAKTKDGIWVLTAPDGGEAGLAPYGIKPRP